MLLSLSLVVGCGSDGRAADSAASGASSAGAQNVAGGTNSAGSSVGGASAGSGAGGASGASAGSSSVGGAESNSGGSAGAPFGSGGTGGAKIDYGAGGLIEPGVPPAYNPCANLSVCTILPLGDSITFGDRSSDQAGWRSRLFHLALSGKKSITFTGGQTNGPDSVDGVPFPKHHQGHPGYEISGPHGIQYFTAQSVTTFPAQILTLLIGTNDMAVNNDPPNAPARLAELIDLILATDPKLLVVVGLITPTQDDGLNALVQAYNAAIPGIVSARAAAGKHIALIDLWTPLTSNPNYKTELLDDKLHPNDAGYSKMAETWYKMLGGLFPTAP